MLPRISVVLPFRDAEATLSRAIKSIVEQSFTDWELVLIDHASTDGSAAIAQQWKLRDSRIRLIQQPQDGFVGALNRGLDEAVAPFITRMDADDISYPERLAKQLLYLQQHPTIDAIGCGVRYCTAGEPQIGMQAYVDWANGLNTYRELLLNRFVESPLVHPSVMFRSRLIAKYGPYRNGVFPEDYELWLRWLSRGVRIAKHPEILLDWYDSDCRLSRTHERYRPAAFYYIKTRYLAE